jgi:hypothetical protein
VTKRGKPVAMLLPPDEDTLYELQLLNSPKFLAVIQKGWKQIQEGKCMNSEEFWRRVKERTARREARTRRHGRVRKKPAARSRLT